MTRVRNFFKIRQEDLEPSGKNREEPRTEGVAAPEQGDRLLVVGQSERVLEVRHGVRVAEVGTGQRVRVGAVAVARTQARASDLQRPDKKDLAASPWVLDVGHIFCQVQHLMPDFDMQDCRRATFSTRGSLEQRYSRQSTGRLTLKSCAIEPRPSK